MLGERRKREERRRSTNDRGGERRGCFLRKEIKVRAVRLVSRGVGAKMTRCYACLFLSLSLSPSLLEKYRVPSGARLSLPPAGGLFVVALILFRCLRFINRSHDHQHVRDERGRKLQPLQRFLARFDALT